MIRNAAIEEFSRKCSHHISNQEGKKADRFSGGVVGCQDERGGDVIVLCKPFWRWSPERIGNLAIQTQPISLELDKWRSRPAILLHELTHALFRSVFSKFYAILMLLLTQCDSFRPSLVP